MATAAAQPARAAAAAGHWPEYLMEAALLGLFMLSACGVTTLLDHPASAGFRAVPDPLMRRFLTGLAMGSTAIALIYSPWGRRSGAHFNPAATLAFLRLRRIAPRDAGWYAAAQFAGGIAGVLLAAATIGAPLAHETVRYAVTRPGPAGFGPAWVSELVIAYLLMSVVLRVSAHPRYGRLTGICVGVLVAVYITVEAPLSGMSMNPARSLASAAAAGEWMPLWIYFTAPPLGMLLAAELHLRRGRPLACAKLDHDPAARCIHCEYRQGRSAQPVQARVPAWNRSLSTVIEAASSKGAVRMNRRVIVAALVLLGAVGWYLFRPELLFVDTRVDEELATAAQTGGPVGPVALAAGAFHSVAHETHGTATVLEVDGRRLLRLTDFATSNGPDVRVYLVAAPDAADNDAVTRAGFVELGKLKGNEGDQNYDVPADLDLNLYRAVTIWCARFGVNFATAPLTPAS
jgi:aquaporin Z